MNSGQLKDMVERVPWMSPIDYEIILFFDNHDILASPKVVSVNIDYDRQYTSKRLSKLEEAGLLVKESSGLYQLSDLARDFLNGEIDADELDEPE
jgi:DNA-binding MarR family transcriptional regulator